MKATALVNRYDIKAYKLFPLLHEFDKLLLGLELPTRKRGRPPKLKSTLSYWEQKAEMKRAMSSVLSLLSEKLEKLRYKRGVLYLASYCFTSSRSMAADKIREGPSFLLADRWYDDKQVLYKVVEMGLSTIG